MAATDSMTNPEDGALRDRIEVCLTAAELLTDLLEEERSILKAFDADRLLGLIPRKEFLVTDLFRSLSLLEGGRGQGWDEGTKEGVDRLRASLKNIERINGFNRVFVEHSLSHWQHLMTAMDLPGYGPGNQGTGAAFLSRGFHFRGEA